MKRSICCKSELVYITDGTVKIDRVCLGAVNELIERKMPQTVLWFECGLCHKMCELTQLPDFTREQIDWICYQIGDWYLMMKPLLEGQHNLGHMKEKLKMMICGDERENHG